MRASASGGPPVPPRTVSLGDGIRVPYPSPSSASASAKGRANRRSGSQSERAVRSAVHRRGLRFRVDHAVLVGGLRVRPDLVFTRAMVAVFVDGCFWHRCPLHGTVPKSNLPYWLPKLERNVERDPQVTIVLRSVGWTVVRAWEHEDPIEVADEVERLVRGEAQDAADSRHR